MAGIPARDLSKDDITKYVIPVMVSFGIKTSDPEKWLIETGLYEAEPKKAKEIKPIIDKKDGE